MYVQPFLDAHAFGDNVLHNLYMFSQLMLYSIISSSSCVHAVAMIMFYGSERVDSRTWLAVH